MLIYFYYKEYQNIQIIRLPQIIHSIGLANQIANLTKKSRNTLQLKKTISFKMKHI